MHVAKDGQQAHTDHRHVQIIRHIHVHAVEQGSMHAMIMSTAQQGAAPVLMPCKQHLLAAMLVNASPAVALLTAALLMPCPSTYQPCRCNMSLFHMQLLWSSGSMHHMPINIDLLGMFALMHACMRTCRYLAALAGEDPLPEEEPPSSSSELIPLLSHATCSAHITALHWTQSGDALLCADSASVITLWSMPQKEGMPMTLLWTTQLEVLSQRAGLVISAGLDAESAVAVGVLGSKQVSGPACAHVQLMRHIVLFPNWSQRRKVWAVRACCCLW